MKCYILSCRALILLDLVFLALVFSSVAGEVHSDKSILLDFKRAVSDPSGILSSWDSNSSDHCSWSGVSCDLNSRVTSLDIGGGYHYGGNTRLVPFSKLPRFPNRGFGVRKIFRRGNRKLVGKLLPVMGKLSELRVLSLPCNDLSGEIPLEIWNLEKLEILDLHGNQLNGELPDQFTGLRRLRVLNLGFNSISGRIPVSLSKCAVLKMLDLAGNQLNGTIPGFRGKFLNLQGVYLSQNRLSGVVPAEFGQSCENLGHLDLSGNILVGSIPRSLGNCRRLQTLLLFSNKLNGVIPRELGQLQMLEVLDISRNNLSGSIPTELGSCVKLSVLVLSNLFNPLRTNKDSIRGSDLFSDIPGESNSFEGSLPDEITKLPNLRIVWAPKANLKGKLPSSWGSCESLEILSLALNHFSGEMVGVFQRCKKLHFLDLSSNKITGKLDEKLPLPCMNLFDISGNILSGSIPSFNRSACPPHVSPMKRDPFGVYASFFARKSRLHSGFPSSGATRLVIHNFGGNIFSGPIVSLPIAQKIMGKQADYAFLAGGNMLSGSFPESLFGRCEKLNGMIININGNQFSGRIPFGIGSMCRSLQIFDASDNQFSGPIPPSLGDLRSLVVLDLGQNKFQGPIPSEIGHLKHLRYLSLASNHLNGSIPSSFARLNSLEVLKLSSNSLSGEIPPSLVRLRKLTVILLGNNKLLGEIPSGLAVSASLSLFNVSDTLSGSFQLKKAINCSSVLGDCLQYPYLIAPPTISSRELLDSSGTSLNNAVSPSVSATPAQNTGLNSIEIASVVSASAIVSVLLALVCLFIYTRKWVPGSRVRVSESREITVFSDIGVPLTFEGIVRATGNFSAGNCIGNGGFGATYKAEISPGTLLAVKRLAVGRFQGVQQFHAEIKTLERVRHPNLVTLVGYHASETEMFLIYNFLPGGNLENFIKERSRRAADWKVIHKIALDIARALAYLHDECDPRVLHRDVKPSNILLDNELKAYLSDFGLSRLLGTSETHATTGVAGTFGYVAPEYAMTCRVSEKADVYSYGVVLLELISDKKALDPSFSSHGNGFNIVSWACMQLRLGNAKEVFTAGLWESGPHNHLVEMLHLAITCTVETLSTRPTMKQVVRKLKHIQPSSS